MKVLILTRTFDCGGTEAAMISLLNQMIKMDYQIKILCMEKKGPFLERVPEQVEVQEIQFKNDFYRFVVKGKQVASDSLKIILFKILQQVYWKMYPVKKGSNNLYNNILKKLVLYTEEFDMVLDFYGYGHFLTAYAANYKNVKKRAMWIHDENIHWMYKIEEYLPFFDRIFCVSNAVKSAFLKKHSEYDFKTEVFYNQTNVEQIRKNADDIIEDNNYYGDFKILTVGRLEKQKGLDIAIETASILKQRKVNFKWYVIGDGAELKKISRLIKEYRVENEFILLGRKSNPYPYMKQCQFYIQPSRHEGYATTIVEAKALGKPIIASDIPSNQEQITNGRNGFLVPLKACEFADIICEIIYNPEMVKNIVKVLQAEPIDFSGEIRKLENLFTEDKERVEHE